MEIWKEKDELGSVVAGLIDRELTRWKGNNGVLTREEDRTEQ